MKTVAITLMCYNRVDELKRVLGSVKSQTYDLSKVKLFINREPGNDEIREIIESIDWVDTDIKHNKEKMGINGNSYDVLERAYSEFEEVLYIEDDTVLSYNALQWSKDMLDHYSEKVASICLCNLWDAGDPGVSYLSRSACYWGYMQNREQFRAFRVPTAFPVTGMWDNSMAKYTRAFKGIYNVFPALSRATNIGKHGEHMDPKQWEKFMGGHKYLTESRDFEYYHTNMIMDFDKIKLANLK